jgi:hypothetical protein
MWLTVDGVKKPLVEWAEIYGIGPTALRSRIVDGWDVKFALTAPLGSKKHQAAV